MRAAFPSAALVSLLVVGTANLTALAESPGRQVVPFKARPFELTRIRLLDGPFRDAMERDRRYLHELDSNRLLHTFRINAGLPSSAEPLGGWEKPDSEVRGHTLGHYLSACALMVSSTGDVKLKEKANAIVAELARCQKALGTSGYLSAFPETWIDRAEARQRVWAPYYTLHKIYAGLLDIHRHCGNRQALEVARKMAAWNKTRLDKLDQNTMQAMLDHTEQGGMNDALANLYAATADRTYLTMARRFDQKRYVDPLSRGEDRLKGEHVNSFIPNIIGTARQYELSGNGRDRRIAEYFWDQVTRARCYATGGTSNHEHWRTGPGKLAQELSDFTQENCCTYNMLKLTRHLFSWNAAARYADYYERALYNSILSTQNPRSGMMSYFVVLAPGRWKVFNLPTDSFWCCTGTGLENHAKYGDSIYFHDDEGLFVNLFIASELDWKERGLRVRQETKFPEEERTTLVFRTEQPVEATIRLRVPYWATRGIGVRLGGEKVASSAKPGSYLALRRTWRDGDRLEVDLPMALHAAPMPDDDTVVALMYGPLVLAGELGGEGLTDENTHVSQNWYRFPNPASAPAFVTETTDLRGWIRPVPDRPLTFRTVGQERNVTLVPYHKLFDQRYAVYWRIFQKGSAAQLEYLEAEQERKQREAEEEAARKRILLRLVDECQIGDPVSEKAHGLKHERSASGPHQDRMWRHAADGWFSYDFAVLPDRVMTLSCTYWGSDAGQRTFDILVDGVKIATQKLDRDKPDRFFDVQYPIPLELTRDKRKVTVRFQAHPGHIAGGVFGCAMLKPKDATTGP